MQVKAIVIPAALALLTGCGAPSDMSDMRVAVEERLENHTPEAPG